jgi:hypothetical protein
LWINQNTAIGGATGIKSAGAASDELVVAAGQEFVAGYAFPYFGTTLDSSFNHHVMKSMYSGERPVVFV